MNLLQIHAAEVGELLGDGGGGVWYGGIGRDSWCSLISKPSILHGSGHKPQAAE